jgi:hypothetical protein
LSGFEDDAFNAGLIDGARVPHLLREQLDLKQREPEGKEILDQVVVDFRCRIVRVERRRDNVSAIMRSVSNEP